MAQRLVLALAPPDYKDIIYFSSIDEVNGLGLSSKRLADSTMHGAALAAAFEV